MINTKPSRYPSRSVNDRETIYNIVDEGLFCTVAYIKENVPYQIPTGFCRVENDIYIHASSKSAFINGIIGEKVSYSITHLDALVLSPTAFDHSFNYRSVIGFSMAEEVLDSKMKGQLFNIFTDRYIPGRIVDVGEPTDEQIEITKIIKLSLENSAAKVRSGDVNVKMGDQDPWCGIIPITTQYEDPIKDNQLSEAKKVPDYIKKLVNES